MVGFFFFFCLKRILYVFQVIRSENNFAHMLLVEHLSQTFAFFGCQLEICWRGGKNFHVFLVHISHKWEVSRVGKRRATQCFAFQPTSPNRRDATAPLVLSPATQRWPPPPTPPHCVATLLPYAPLVVIISLFNASITRGLVVAAPPPY